MTVQSEALARVRAVLEEELGDLRVLAHLPSSEIETMAARLARALAPVIAAAQPEFRRDAA